MFGLKIYHLAILVGENKMKRAFFGCSLPLRPSAIESSFIHTYLPPDSLVEFR
jgi:hypothetical protein